MAEILHEFTAGTKAKASEINDNFAFVRKEMVELNNETSSFLNEELRTFKEGIILDLEATAETKLNKDLSNIEDKAYSAIFSDLGMNTEAGVSVSSGWTADKNGWLSLFGRSGQGSYSAWLINDVEVFRNDQAQGGERAGRVDTRAVAFIAKGQVLTSAGKGSANATFYPCIGEN